MGLTTDPNDPCLKAGQKSEGQNSCYLVLSEEERAKGFIRPIRDTYIHKGRYVGKKWRELTTEEKDRYHKYDYAAFVPNEDKESAVTGTFISQKELDKIKDGYVAGCGAVTKMGYPLAETYARDPKFYGATFCIGCNKHLPVGEFIWDGTNENVGS